MNAYVVVEGPTDVILITRLLPEDVRQQTAVVAAGVRGNVTSAARTLLVTKRKPVAIVRDADTVDEPSVVDLRRETEELLRAVSGGVPIKVVVMMPEIETLFFTVPAAIERITGRQLSTDEVALAKYKPAQVISQLGQPKSEMIEQIVNGLTADDVKLIQQASPIRELIEFLSEKVVPQQSQTA